MMPKGQVAKELGRAATYFERSAQRAAAQGKHADIVNSIKRQGRACAIGAQIIAGACLQVMLKQHDGDNGGTEFVLIHAATISQSGGVLTGFDAETNEPVTIEMAEVNVISIYVGAGDR